MTTAKQVPALVLAHQDYLRGEGYRQYATKFFKEVAGVHMDSKAVKEFFTEHQREQVAATWCHQSTDLLNISQLFHVSDSMTEVAKIAAERLDPEEVWGVEILPALHGVLVFEKPLELLDVWGRVVTIAAVQWTTDLSKKTLSLSEYTDCTTPNDQYNQILALNGNLEYTRQLTGLWSLAHVEAIKFGKPLGGFFLEDDPDVQEYREKHTDTTAPELVAQLLPATPGRRPIFGNMTTVLFAIWALMDQTITTVTEETDKRLARMAVKRKRPPPMVTVIQLRRKESHGYHEEGTGRWLNYRSYVRPHWRRQHYKDGTVRRLYILSYVRGPEDAPFYSPKRVSTLAR